MSETQGTLAKVLKILSQVMSPLAETEDQNLVDLLFTLGVKTASAPNALLNLKSKAADVKQSAQVLEGFLETGSESSTEGLEKISALGGAVTEFFITAFQLGQDLANDPGLSNCSVEGLGEKLLGYFTALFLQNQYPAYYNALLLTGLLEADVVNGDDENIPQHVAYRLQFGRIKQWFTDPGAVLKELYGWGTDRLYAGIFLERLRYLLLSLGVISDYMFRSNPSAGLSEDAELGFPIERIVTQEGELEFGLRLGGVPATQAGSDAGLGLYPYGSGQLATSIRLAEDWSLKLNGQIDLESGLMLRLRPPFNPEIVIDPGKLAFKVSGDLIWAKGDGARIQLLSQPDWLKLDIAGLDFGVGFSTDSAGKTEIYLEAKLNDGALLITPGEGDSFLKKVLPPDGIKAVFEIGVGWSSLRGIYISGGGGLELTLPVHLDLFGVFMIDSIYIGAFAKESEIKTSLALSVSLKIGPISAAVERIGANVLITFPPDGGNLGSANAEFKFKPPNGLGMAVDAGVVVGGGYLFFDPDNAKYAGILQLEVAKKIAIKVIGLLTTRMPDGSDGFSLLLIICVEFPPIQLGFGFTLNGIGGLLGVNRTMVLDALRAGVKNRTLNSIMFPQDPIKNAAKIISDLSTVFPPAEGKYVFGPMVMLGWGSPEPLLKIELGIVLEIPSPVRLAILGRITLALPNEKAALVLIHLDILGAIDFDKCDASVDASLYDSRVVMFVITGDMALRLNWGPKSVFIVSMGGFHPSFPPPPNFPTLERLAISLATGDNPRLRLESYMAVTSNTIQFGARLDIYAGISIAIIGTFSARANMSMDAFIQFSPFWFQVDIEASAAIYHNDDVLIGVRLALSLSGPEPWHAWGEATFNFLGKHSISFDVTIEGDQPAPPPLPPVDPLPDLLVALRDSRNWSAQLPEEGNMIVALKQITPGSDVLAHPFGVLTVRQKIMPLGVAFQKFGASPVASPKPYILDQVQLGNFYINSPDEVKDQFAPGQFFELRADEKLSRPAFEAFTAGNTNIGSKDIRFNDAQKIKASFEYETVVIDAKDIPKPKTETRSQSISNGYTMAPEVAESLTLRGAAANTPLRSTGSNQFQGPKKSLSVNQASYVIVNKRNLTPAPGAIATTYTEAKLKEQGLDTKKEEWQVVGSHEVKSS